MVSTGRITSLIALCLVSTIACGFSSWIYVENNKASINGSVSVGDVQYMAYFSMNKNDIKMFSIGPDGLVDDEKIVNKASIDAKITIDNTRCYPLSDNGKFTFQLVLTCSDLTFLKTYIPYSGNPTITPSISVNSTKPEAHPQLVSFVTCQIKSTGTTDVDVKYAVKDDSNGTIKDYASKRLTFDFKIRSKQS